MSAQSLSSSFYDIGSPVLYDYFVSPSSGDDKNNGRSISSPKRTVSNLWNDIPRNSLLSTGIRINLLPGTYGAEELPNYWEDRIGSARAPIILRAYEGYGSVFFTRDINMAGVSYFYLIGVDIKNITEAGYGDAFHAERCDHVLLRANSFNGAPNGLSSGRDVAHETIKFNQSKNIYIENNNIQGADDNGIDFVAVFGGHVRANRIHGTQGWCMYAKGGSANLLLESNLVYDCGEGGITAGQGTGLEFMEAPYLRYEANYIKIVNNIIYDVAGAALGVNGGYNILIAHNTAYKIGSRSHLIEVVFGERSCDGDTLACQSRRNAGGWGPAIVGSEASQPIGNQNVLIFNNVIYNPNGFSSASQHFAIYGPRSPSVSEIPSPQVTDLGLVIKGNIVWNGGLDMPLGVEGEGQGCQIANPTCNSNQIRNNNLINTLEPDFISAATADFRPINVGFLSSVASSSIEDFGALEAIAGAISEGDRSNSISRDFSGAAISLRPPGAIANASSSVDFPTQDPGAGVPPIGNIGLHPTLSIAQLTAKRIAGKVVISISVKASSKDGIASVEAIVSAGKKKLSSFKLKSTSGKYFARKNLRTIVKKLSFRIVALDRSGRTSSKTKNLKVINS